MTDQAEKPTSEILNIIQGFPGCDVQIHISKPADMDSLSSDTRDLLKKELKEELLKELEQITTEQRSQATATTILKSVEHAFSRLPDPDAKTELIEEIEE